MKDTRFTVRSSRTLTESVYELVLEGDTSDFTRPGQFVEISVPGFFLRRPISVSDWDANTLTLLIKEAGHGTGLLRTAFSTPGSGLQVVTGLGNGFDLDAAQPGGAAVVGGGIGIAPLYGLARRLAAAGKPPVAVLGFRNASEIFLADKFATLGCKVALATEDGSSGTKGFVTDVLRALPGTSYVYACGPMPMLKAVAALPSVSGGQFSLEARMGCGFGACVGCTIQTVHGPARVCCDGPVFKKEEIAW